MPDEMVEKVARAIPDEAELVDAIAIICMELGDDRSAENAAAMFRAYGGAAHDCPEHNNGTRVPYGCGRCDVEVYRSHARRILSVMEREGEAVAWVIPGDDNARDGGFIDAKCYRDGEFTQPLYASPSPEAPSYTSDRVFDGVRSMSPEAAAAHVERVKRVMGEREGKPVGLFANLTPEQQAAALAYRGPENLMPSRPEAYIKGAIADLRHAYNHMVNDRVKDIEALARGLIGPAIERLEQAITAET